MISGTCQFITSCTFLPSAASINLRDMANREDGTCIEWLGARVAFLAQAAASVAGTAFCLLAAIFAPPLILCSEGQNQAWNALTHLGKYTCLHLSLIPTSLIAAILPHPWNYFSPAEELSIYMSGKSLVAAMRQE
jgi:hypothetical protein